MPTRCHLCGHEGLIEIEGYPALRRVTSDCRPWPAGGRLAVCPRCAGLQKVLDDAFAAEAAAIEAGYVLYHQGAGGEQRVFDQATGRSRPRSEILVAHLAGHLGGATGGRLLDVGCGHGHFLKNFRARFPDFALAGLEQGERCRRDVEALGAAYYDGPEGLDGPAFDAVTCNHSLEHIPNPAGFLATLAGRLRPDGVLAVNVPRFDDNPFDLLIADHCTHFDAGCLDLTLARAGFTTLRRDGARLPKEWLAAARPGSPAWDWPGERAAQAAADRARTALSWLAALAGRAAGLSGPLGVFGTAIAGVWLFHMLDGRADFFVDEDPGRAGARLFERPVHTPADVPAGATVFLPLPSPIAAKIKDRLAGTGLNLVTPP